MVVAKCISKNRNNRGAIVNYTLQDQTGQQKVVTGQQIKQAIKAGRIMITNLQIDKAGRLIDKTENKITIPEKNNNNINSKIKERQAEIFVNFIKSIKYDTHCEEFNIEDMQVKSEATNKKILELCEKDLLIKNSVIIMLNLWSNIDMVIDILMWIGKKYMQ